MTHSARLIGRCTTNFMGRKDISVISAGKGTTRRYITVCIWTGTKLYNATDKSAYFVTQVINMNVRFHILALSVLMWKVCFMEFFFFFLPEVLFVGGYVSWNKLSESTYWKSLKKLSDSYVCEFFLKKFITSRKLSRKLFWEKSDLTSHLPPILKKYLNLPNEWMISILDIL